MDLGKKIRKALNKRILTYAAVAAMGLPAANAQTHAKEKQDFDNPKDKKVMLFSQDNFDTIYKDAYRPLEFQVDTLTPSIRDVFEKTLGYYSFTENAVTLNHYEGSDSLKDKLQRFVLANHEGGHQEFSNSYEGNLSMAQSLNMYRNDEIRSRIIEVVAYRQGYIESADKKAYLSQEVEGSFLNIYKDSIAEGKLNPLSINPQDFKKEMAFIGQGAFDDYVEGMTNIAYDGTHLQWVYNGLNSGDKKYESNPQYYKQITQEAFTIGGYNFAQHMELKDGEEVFLLSKDRQYSMNRVEKLLKEGADKTTIKLATENVAPVKFPKYNGKISVEEYYCLLQHYAINEAHKFQLSGNIEFGYNLDANGRRAAESVLKSHYLGKEIAELTLKAYEHKEDAKSNPALYKKMVEKVYKKNKALLTGINYDLLITSKAKKGIDNQEDLLKKLKRHEAVIKSRETMFKRINRGTPVYAKYGDDNRRVSEVLNMPVINTKGNFLQRELEAKKYSYAKSLIAQRNSNQQTETEVATKRPEIKNLKLDVKRQKSYE